MGLKYTTAFCSSFVILVPEKFLRHIFNPPPINPTPPIINFWKSAIFLVNCQIILVF